MWPELRPEDREYRPCPYCGHLQLFARSATLGWHPIEYHDCKGGAMPPEQGMAKELSTTKAALAAHLEGVRTLRAALGLADDDKTGLVQAVIALRVGLAKIHEALGVPMQHAGDPDVDAVAGIAALRARAEELDSALANALTMAEHERDRARADLESMTISNRQNAEATLRLGDEVRACNEVREAAVSESARLAAEVEALKGRLAHAFVPPDWIPFDSCPHCGDDVLAEAKEKDSEGNRLFTDGEHARCRGCGCSGQVVTDRETSPYFESHDGACEIARLQAEILALKGRKVVAPALRDETGALMYATGWNAGVAACLLNVRAAGIAVEGGI
jgi:hypothetical protein